MKIIYVVRRNHYAAILAAYIHLGIKNTPGYENNCIDKMQYKYLGISKGLEEVYIANCGSRKGIFMNLLEGWRIIDDIELKIVDLTMFDAPPYLFSRKLTKLVLEKSWRRY